MSKEWFKEWFDTKYYHLLYHDRDDKEAKNFITHLINYLNCPPASKVLDLACGKGRHSKSLAENNLDVTGIDLSENSIKEAAKFEKENLEFHVHDMRIPFGKSKYDYVFNLFTSFGYFDNELDNHKVIQSVYDSLAPSGEFILDFINSNVLSEYFEIKKCSGIEFRINKKIQNHRIEKSIDFYDNGREYSFKEQLTAFTQQELNLILESNGFIIENTFGNYQLKPYIPSKSERIIIHAKKRAN